MKGNRNVLYADVAVEALVESGVGRAVISPGSRNTPLVAAFHKRADVETTTIVDERSAAFFALGLAKATREPVAIVCTSGAAAAEYFPAIVEAYQRRTPILALTADRPPELVGKGANQTIDQRALYANHLRGFFDARPPDLAPAALARIRSLANEACRLATVVDPGPVQINFPFRKPLEPEAVTDEFDPPTPAPFKDIRPTPRRAFRDLPSYAEIVERWRNAERPLLSVGPEPPGARTRALIELAESSDAPILADAASQYRFGAVETDFVVSTYDALLRALDDFPDPDIWIHFGATPTSLKLEEFAERTSAERYLVNPHGDWFDPGETANVAIAADVGAFAEALAQDAPPTLRRNRWRERILGLERTARGTIEETTAPFPFEASVARDLVELLPEGASLVIGNSLPVRDVDWFAPTSAKALDVFVNRGASGIDGIISTALGAATGRGTPTALLIGDLSFFYDSTALAEGARLGIPLVIA
ncbi:MAG: 2-succinyl-5-enolpyruvyl-6-hydroxy-3-cyclohexene-1-carboxylic-acid synthase, partial [Ignavibacteriales bacterium]|nr:2-succinyl-5-enolpyruvyl-6-hydroxy-3-cyclohexene-1-carboxylic-acid synthase [Ignavibacteriales bacterium]